MKEWITARRLDDLYDILNQRLSPKRVRHVLGVAETTVRLASLWGADLYEALVAALLHDIGKEEEREAQRARIERSSQGLNPEDRDFPGIWHAVSGEIIAREEFGVTSPPVLRAIRLHPTGDGEMSCLERIIFLSDYIEPTRTYDGVAELRRLARLDLEAAVDKAILKKTSSLLHQGKTLHARSRRALRAAEERK